MKSEKQVIVQQVIMRPLADLVPNPKNPRTATEEEIAALAESIKANPDYFDARPIVLSNRTGVMMIIDGEQRSKAAKLLGMVEVPTILMEGLTEAQEDEIMVRGNTHAGKWDDAKLKVMADKWGEEPVKGWNPDYAWKLHKGADRPGKEGNGFVYQPKFGIVVICGSEVEQEEVYERLTSEGFECKVVSV